MERKEWSSSDRILRRDDEYQFAARVVLLLYKSLWIWNYLSTSRPTQIKYLKAM